MDIVTYENDRKLGDGEMVPWVKAPAPELDDMNSTLGPVWWKERIDSLESCPLASPRSLWHVHPHITHKHK